MSELEEKLNNVLNNPQMMQQIMSMAQAMGASPQQSQPVQEPKQENTIPSGVPNLDPKMLQNLAGIARQSNVDQNQQALLHALSPYLSRERVSKLERAMRAAKLAGAASAFLNSGGLKLLAGR